MATLEKPKVKKPKKPVPLKINEKQEAKQANTTLNSQSTTKDEAKETVQDEITVDVCAPEEAEHKETNSDETHDDVTQTVTSENKPVERIEPTAPLEEIHQISYPVLPLQETTSSPFSLPLQETSAPQQEQMKPFTRAQLAALYTNNELAASKEFERCFVQSELRACASARHPLHAMLREYASARERARDTRAELERFTAELKTSEERAWLVEAATARAIGSCQDGQTVRVSHDYQTARLQRQVVDEISRLQQQIRELANETHALTSYSTVTLNLKIDHYLHTVINNSLMAQVGRQNSTAVEPSVELKDLRQCISILFWFQRRQTRDRELVTESRLWLSGCAAALLRLADWQDHAYLLCHVLRAPPGVGQWAARYVQVPLGGGNIGEIFADRQLNHALVVVGMLLRSIEKREDFLEHMTSSETQDNVWVVVDSDGEEDDCGPTALKENDLVALLNQIPLDELFRSILQVKKNDTINMRAITEHHILRLFAFCTVLVDLLNEGLYTYGTQRYNQFVKRLCRLIRHTVQYTSDIYELFRNTKPLIDESISDRLQLEFDMFFLRCGRYLHKAQSLGAWQFLAVLPFHTVTMRRLWQFFYMLHEGSDGCLEDEMPVDYRERLAQSENQQQFEDRLCMMGVEESYYLLNTFANMIMAREDEDREFIQFATINLLQIGFIGESTQETCSKPAAILLSNITTRYPHLISDILHAINLTLQRIGQLSLYLLHELPLHLWRPTPVDMGLLGAWVTQHAPGTLESRLARLAINEMCWEGGERALPAAMHVWAGLLAAEVVGRWCVEGEMGGASADGHALQWAWRLVFRLRLHATDRGVTDFSRVPDLVSFDLLQNGVRSQQPLCSFLSLMMTTTGHLVPLVCSHGFTQLQVLLAAAHPEAALVALQAIVPLFTSCPESLAISPSFQNILTTLLSTDRSYVKMARNLLTGGFPGPVVRQLASIVRAHGRALLAVWARALVAPAAWRRDQPALYVLDVIAGMAYLDREARRELDEVLTKVLETQLEQNAGGGSLLSWVGVGGAQSPPTVLGSTASQPLYPYLSAVCLELEHELLETRTGLWPELLKQLANNASTRTNIDSCLKKTCGLVKVPTFTSSGLCLYRWAQQALDTPLEHPILPLIWQRFFQLYLERELVTGGCQGSKFFDGVVNTTFCKKLKRRLQETVTRYESAEVSGDTSASRCHAVFRAYVLWLEEPLLQEASLYLPSLPPQYELRYLAHILNGDTTPWADLVDISAIRAEHEKSLTEWQDLCGRAVQRRPVQPCVHKDTSDPAKRLVRRLASYDRPQSPPELPRDVRSRVPVLASHSAAALSKALQPHLHRLGQLSEMYGLQLEEFLALDSQYRELLPHLYKMVSTSVKRKKTCKPTCSRHAVVTINFIDARINDAVRQQMAANRCGAKSLLARAVQPLDPATVLACAAVERAADELCARSNRQGETETAAAEMFHLLVQLYDDKVAKYPPTHQLYTTCIDKLGASFISTLAHETARLCRSILEQPNKSSLTISHFNPKHVTTPHFLQMYSDMVDKLTEAPAVVNALLSKMDIPAWLSEKRPRLAERSQFINLVFAILSKLGVSPVPQFQGLHTLARRHILLVFRYEFPEHYGEILRLTLSTSADGVLDNRVWRDLLSVLVWPMELSEKEPSSVELRQLSANQRMLRQDVLVETTGMLARYFTQERGKYGAVYGVYPRYRGYIPQLSVLLSFISQSLISTVVSNTGVLADKLVEVTFPRILDLYGPWILPWWSNESVTLPWLQADCELGRKMFTSYADCIILILDTLPASITVLSHVWQFYTTGYAHTTIKPHILTIIHAGLSILPWEIFRPSIHDLESMVRSTDQYLPEVHSFVHRVFLAVDWTRWLTAATAHMDTIALVKIHVCLLHLLVKLAGEGSEDDLGPCRLLNDARYWAWRLVRPNEISQVLDWYVMSADARVVLGDDEANVKKVDHAVLRLLQTVCCYETSAETPLNTGPENMMKRQCFLRASMKLLVNYSSRHKVLFTSKPQLLQQAVNRHLDIIESVVHTISHNPREESDLLLTEILSLINNTTVSTPTLDTVEAWLSSRSPSSQLLLSLLRSASTVVGVAEAAGRLLEAALTAYFGQSADRAAGQSGEATPTWTLVVDELRLGPPRLPPVEKSLVVSGRLLTLHGIIRKRMRGCDDYQVLMDSVLDWLTDFKIGNDSEHKLPLIWADLLSLSTNQLSLHPPSTNQSRQAASLQRLARLALGVADQPIAGRGSAWGRALVGALTGSRSQTTPPTAKLLARATAGYVLAQLPGAAVRTQAGAPCAVGQPGGSQECARVLLKMDAGVAELKTVVEVALKQIQNPQNSMHNAVDFLYNIVELLYSKPYLTRH